MQKRKINSKRWQALMMVALVLVLWKETISMIYGQGSQWSVLDIFEEKVECEKRARKEIGDILKAQEKLPLNSDVPGGRWKKWGEHGLVQSKGLMQIRILCIPEAIDPRSRK